MNEIDDDNTQEIGPDTVILSPEQLKTMQEVASEFNLTIQGAFLEMMEKMKGVHIDHPGGNIIKGNYAPMALGAAIAAIVERYDPSCEKEFWMLVMNKYSEARTVFEGILDEDGERDGVTTVEMQPNVFDTSKMKH